MSKYLLEDMVRAKRERMGTARKEINEPKREPVREPVRQPITVNYSKKRSRFMLWFIALVSVAFCLFALSFLFSKAEVAVTPKTEDVVLKENLSAVKDSNADGLSFDLVVIDGQENKTVEATGTKDVAIKATGTVVLYNAFSSAPQQLNIDTRLEGSNGKIYKTQTKVIVPGMSKSGTAGSIEVKIYGENAGVEYNSAPLDFKIAGFKGTPRYAKFYGRSKGEITGGFKGKAPVVPDADQLVAATLLKNTLQAKLLQKATDQIPEGFILFKDAVFLNTGDVVVPFTVTDNKVTMTIKGTLYGLLFNEQKLTKKIAGDNIDKYDGSDVFIPNIRDLTFALANKDNISFADVQNINFTLSGSSKIVWRLDENKFTADLLGKPKKDFFQILAQYPNISSAILKLSFPWMQSIPDNTKDVKVIVNYPK